RRLAAEGQGLGGEEDLRGWEWHYQDRLCRGPLRTIKAHYSEGVYGTAQAVAFSPDGRWLASAGGGGVAAGKEPPPKRGELTRGDLATGEAVRRFQGEHDPGGFERVAFSPDGKTLAVAGDSGRTLQLQDAASGRLLHKLDSYVRTVESLAFSADGRQLVF